MTSLGRPLRCPTGADADQHYFNARAGTFDLCAFMDELSQRL
jgi:hypothetical protein